MTTEELQNQVTALLEQIIALQKEMSAHFDISPKEALTPNISNKTPPEQAGSLLDQIESLLGQIKILQDQLKEATEATPPSFENNSKENEYHDALKNASLSGHKQLNEKKTCLTVEFNDSKLSSDVESSLAEIDDFGIEIIDKEKIRKETDQVEKKYDADIKSGEIRLLLGGIVGPFFGFVITTLVNWIIYNILNDLNDKLWEKIKRAFLKIFKSAKSLNEKESISIIACNVPQIVFIIPLSTKEEVALEKMDSIVKLTKEIKESDKTGRRLYKYTYKPNLKTWELETRSDPT